MESWKIESQTNQEGDRIASENVCEKRAENSRRLKLTKKEMYGSPLN